METTLPAKYAKTAQMLMRKKDELEQVFGEARALEADNGRLTSENRELRNRNTELEAAAKSMSFELATLEAQVRKQQVRLQQYIDLEASGHGSNKPRPQDAQRIAALSDEVSELQRKCADTVEQHNKNLEAKHRMQSTIDGANDELKRLREQVTHLTAALDASNKERIRCKEDSAELHRRLEALHEQQQGAAKDTEVLTRLEADALVGLRQEIVALTSENHRLLDQLEDERARHHELRVEHEKYDDTLRRQRYLSDGQLKISRDEVAGLNAQNDGLMAEVRRLMSEREQLRKQVHTAITAEKPPTLPLQQASPIVPAPIAAPAALPELPSPKRRVTTVHRGTMTVEVWVPEIVSVDEANLPPAAAVASLEEAIQERDVEISRQRSQIDVLTSDYDKLSALLYQKTEAAKLRDEMVQLQKIEIDRLHLEMSQWSAATPLERLVGRKSSEGSDDETSTSSVAVRRSDIETVEQRASKVLVAATKSLSVASEVMREVSLFDGIESDTASNCSDTDHHGTYRNAPPSSHGGKFVVPIVPYRDLQNASLNRLMEMLGGLNHIVKQLHAALKVAARRERGASTSSVAAASRGPKGFQAAPVSRSEASWMSGKIDEPASLEVVAPLEQQRPMFDVDEWLSTRKQHPSRISRPEAVPNTAPLTTSTPSTLDWTRGGIAPSYQAGFSLMDSVEQLRHPPAAGRAVHHHRR